MLFRTKFVFAFCALAALAVACAALLMLSSNRSELNQTRTYVAHENLSGYLRLSGSVFRTFKQVRRDLLSDPGRFTFDYGSSAADIQNILDQIERTWRAESDLLGTPRSEVEMAEFEVLRAEVNGALAGIQEAADLIKAGQITLGRQKAVAVLEGQVDVHIAELIEAATNAERLGLASVQEDVRAFQSRVNIIAWVAILIALVLSGLILVTLLRRFRNGLMALEQGALAYSANSLDYVIDLPGQDELSTVAYRFNDMAQQIRIKQQALEKARQDLEQRVAERTSELSAAISELRESDALRRQFFADIGHELRTPVTAIRGEAEVALRTKTNSAAAHEMALTTIVSLSEELTANVGDLFLIAREQAGVLDFCSAPINLPLAVSLGVEQMQSLKVPRNAMITEQPLPEAFTIMGNSSRIAQLVRLLISNALEHAQDNVEIDVSTYIDNTDAVLSVADNGPGIPEKDWPRIFDRYVKGVTRGRKEASGTGLGLAIAKSITQAHNGSIAVRQGPMGGAQILARFPLVQNSQRA